MSLNPSPLVSIVAPCHNEAGLIDAFMARLLPLCAALSRFRFEIVFVDDGSSDATEAVIARLCAEHAHVKGVALSRNFGHQRAITAGLDFCAGDYVIVMDADLQDPPELIPNMLGKLEEGYDVVHAVRADRTVDSFCKRATAKLFYAFMRRWVLPDLVENAADFKGFNRRVLDALRRYPERVQFLRGLF
ncbi:MAG TPA: glycosyltransferase family 2 protein, partial [Candidatus Hydrogenedentes bacterium]|nr:glycosyltransferase family 2 protein [Candidatus Hydrogenedentota bacterium]